MTAFGAATQNVAVSVGAASPLAGMMFIHVDHLNTPRAIYDSAQQLRWKWEQQEPFGVNPPDENPSSLGAYEFNLRFPGQYFDKETNLHYNYFRDFDPLIGRYVQSDPLGLGGGLNNFAYANSSPISNKDPLGLMCVSGNGMTTCFTPGGPTFMVPTPPGYPQMLTPGNIGYHIYVVQRSIGCADPDAVMQGLIASPAPGANPATPQGTPNNVSVLNQTNLVTSYSTTDLITGAPIVVNIAGTNDGSAFGPGYVARYVQNGQAITMGEGLNWKQDPEVSGRAFQEIANQLFWGSQMSKIIANCKCK